VLDAIGLSGVAIAGKRLTVLRAIDMLDRLGAEGVRALLGEGRKDESGDFTSGAGLDAKSAARLLEFVSPQELTSGSSDDVLLSMPQTWDGLHRNETFEAGLGELREIKKLVESGGYGKDRVEVNQTVVRGLEYYTGPVFEIELTFEIKDEDGRPIRFGSVGGGGRYDGLVGRFRGESVPATGFSMGVSRLMAALAHLGKAEARPQPGPVVVTVFDRERMADYQRMVAALRNAGIRAELYLGTGRMGAQLKYADRRGAPCVVIQGADEKAKGEVQIKDLIAGARAAAAIASHEEWRESRPAQLAVREDALVEAVREVLAREDISWETA